MSLVLWLIMILLGLWLADFVTACVHWSVDNYASRDWPIIGPYYVAFAHDHHDTPLEILRLPFFTCHWFIFTFSAIMGAGLLLTGSANLVTMSALIFGALTNFIHSWSHRSASENGPVITALHKVGLLQSPRHHGHHHKNDSSHYALLTDHINPILEASRLFQHAEAMLAKLGLHKHWWENMQKDKAIARP